MNVSNFHQIILMPLRPSHLHVLNSDGLYLAKSAIRCFNVCICTERSPVHSTVNPDYLEYTIMSWEISAYLKSLLSCSAAKCTTFINQRSIESKLYINSIVVLPLSFGKFLPPESICSAFPSDLYY